MKNPEIGEVWTMRSVYSPDKSIVKIVGVNNKNDSWRVTTNYTDNISREVSSAFYGRDWFLEFLPSSTLVEQTLSPIVVD